MKNRTTLPLLAVLSICAAGCSTEGSNAASSVAAVESAEQTKPNGNAPSTNTVKSGAGLRFFHQMERPVAANSAHSVTLSIGHDYPGQNLALTASADDGLSLAADRNVAALVQGRNAQWTIPFTARANGVYYINVIGTVAVPGRASESRVYAVRVEVGPQNQAQKPRLEEVVLTADEKVY